jgi:hypothetical protein
MTMGARRPGCEPNAETVGSNRLGPASETGPSDL